MLDYIFLGILSKYKNHKKDNTMRINSIQSYNNNNRIGCKSGYAGNKCYATKVADSVAFKGKDPIEALKDYLVDCRFVSELRVNNITPESCLVYDLGMDTLDLLLFQADILSITGEEIPEEEFRDNFITVGDVVNYMTEHKEAFSYSRIMGLTFKPGYYKLLYND